MKKKFTLEIKNPCSENFDEMKPSSDGSFCNSCAKSVIDLSRKTNSEVSQFIINNKNKNICARLKTSQLQQEFEYNELSKSNNFKYAVAVAASVLFTSNIVGQEKEPVKTEIGCSKPNPHVVGKIAYVKTENKIISFVLKGKLLNIETKKMLSQKQFPNCTIFINGALKEVKVNSTNGDFSIPITIDKTVKELILTIESNNLQISKTIKINTESIINDELYQNIFINIKEFQNYQILGGLGINYSETKKSFRLT